LSVALNLNKKKVHFENERALPRKNIKCAHPQSKALVINWREKKKRINEE